MRLGRLFVWFLVGFLFLLPVATPRATAQVVGIHGLRVGAERFVAYLEGETLRLLNVQAGISRTITTGPVLDARWSPDEQTLAFILEERLFLYDVSRAQSHPANLNEAVPVRLLEWSPDGARLLLLVHLEGREALWQYDRRVDVARPVAEVYAGYGFWLDDARVLVVSSCGSACRTALIVDTRNGQEWPIVVDEPERASLGFALSPDRTRLLSAGADGRLVLYDLATGDSRVLWQADRAAGETLSLQTSFPWEMNHQASAWDPSGRFVVFRVARPLQAGRLVVLDTHTGRFRAFYGQNALWAPDGQHLLLQPGEPFGRSGRLWVVSTKADALPLFPLRTGYQRPRPLAWVGAHRVMVLSERSDERWSLELVDVAGFTVAAETLFVSGIPHVNIGFLSNGDAVVLVRATEAASSAWPGLILLLTADGEMRLLVGRQPRASSTPPPISPPPSTSLSRGADDLVRVGQRLACRSPGLEQAALYALDVLDFLARHPNAPQRDTLVELAVQTLYAGGAPPFDASWLAQAWLERAVLAPLRTSGLPPADDPWHRFTDLYPADVDGDGHAEWLVNVHICSPPGVPAVYGGTLLFDPATQEVHPVPPPKLPGAELFETRTALFPGPSEEVALVADLSGNGRPEVVLSRRWSGAHADFEAWRVLTWAPEGFRDLMALPWETSNGAWSVADLDGDGVAELLALEGGPGSAGFGPFHSYTLVFRLVGGEYVPTDLHFPPLPSSHVEADTGIFHWQRAVLLAHAGRLAEAQRVLETLEQAPPAPEVRPYLLFRLGFLAWLRGDAPAARQAWSRLLADFPDHPLSQDVHAVLGRLSGPDDLGRACARWVAVGRERAVPAQAWLATHPGWWHLVGDDLCLPPLLFRAWAWPRRVPLVEQLARRAFRWRPLLDDHDFNGDGQPDPVGVVTGPCEADACGTAKGALWVFLSDSDEYHPVLVAGGLPAEALLLPLQWPNIYEHATTCGAYQVADLNGDGHPEVVAACEQRVYVWTWNGARFRPFPVATVTLERGQFRFWRVRVAIARDGHGTPLVKVWFFAGPGDTAPAFLHRYRLIEERLELVASTAPAPLPDLGEAVEALFGRRAPDEAIRILRAYRPDSANDYHRPTYRQMALYLYGLAAEYRGDRWSAALAYRLLVDVAPNTPWAERAHRRLKHLPRSPIR